MIPLTDASRRPVRFPIATVTIIVINFIVFFIELAGGDDFINRWSLVPADIVAGHNLITILTSMFMHAGWEHILGNMLFFWVFAPAIEDVMGSVRFTTFYLWGASRPHSRKSSWTRRLPFRTWAPAGPSPR